MNIAIDGVACSGKGTLSQALAKALDIDVFDTGALYRAVAVEWDRQKRGDVETSNIYDFLKSFDISVSFIDKKQHVFISNVDVTSLLRTERISDLSSQLSAFLPVREKVLDIQQSYAKTHNCIMEGRDITSVVLPNADYKFYMTADLEVRAKRRTEQFLSAGKSAKYEEVLEDLRERDYRDMNRPHGQLKLVDGAIILDTTNRTLEDSVNFCLDIIKK